MDRIATCLRVLAERSDLMQEIFNEACRGSLSVMLAAKIEEDKAAQEVQHFLALIFSQQYCFIQIVLASKLLSLEIRKFTFINIMI